jgi:hypothetical protein
LWLSEQPHSKRIRRCAALGGLNVPDPIPPAEAPPLNHARKRLVYDSIDPGRPKMENPADGPSS